MSPNTANQRLAVSPLSHATHGPAVVQAGRESAASLDDVTQLVDARAVQEMLRAGGLPPMHLHADLVAWETVRAHVRDCARPLYDVPGFNKPEHGEPPIERDRIKSIFLRWLFY